MLRAGKRHVTRQLRRHPRVSAAIARGIRRLGTRRMPGRLERAADLAWAGPAPPMTPFHLLRCDGRDQVARDVGNDGWTAFEAPLPAVLARLVQAFCQGGVFTDVGANTGYYALLAAAADPTVVVDAFEPFPPALEVLRGNIAINRADRVWVHPMALSDQPGRLPLFIPNDTHGLVETSSSLNRDFSWGGVGGEVQVEVSTLDLTYPTADTAPQLLKIDVESLEPEVLLGGEQLLQRSRPVVALELLPHIDPGALEAIRARFEYVDIRLRPDTAIVASRVVPDAEAWNHLWCPPEALPTVRSSISDLGIAVVDEP